MEYMDVKIYANAKGYSLWSIDEDGRLSEMEYEYDGWDIIGYTFTLDSDEYPSVEYEFETLQECKDKIKEIKDLTFIK